MNFREKAEKRLVGDRVKLKTLPEYWVQPKRYSVAVKDSINAFATKTTGQLSPETMVTITEKQSRGEDLSAEDRAKMTLEIGTLEAGSYEDQTKLILKGGIHAFGSETEDVPIDDEFFTTVLDWDDLAVELVDIIREANAPLAEKNGDK